MTANPTSLHITIVAGSIHRDGALDLSHETGLVKAALLYADRVTLADPKMMIIASMAGIVSGDLEQQRAAVLGMMDILPDGDATRAVYEELRLKKRKSVREMLVFRGFVERLDRGAGQAVAQVESMLDEAGAGELDEALRAGVVDLNHLGLNESDAGLANVTLWLADLISEIVAPSSPRYPMFDDATDGLLAAMIREGKAPGAALGHAATPAALESRLVGRLDAFPDAPMNAVLEAREVLRGPLTRLREAIAEMQTEHREGAARRMLRAEGPRRHEAGSSGPPGELEDVAGQLRIGRLLGRDLRAVSASGGGRRGGCLIDNGHRCGASGARCIGAGRRPRCRGLVGLQATGELKERQRRTASCSCTRPERGHELTWGRFMTRREAARMVAARPVRHRLPAWSGRGGLRLAGRHGPPRPDVGVIRFDRLLEISLGGARSVGCRFDCVVESGITVHDRVWAPH